MGLNDLNQFPHSRPPLRRVAAGCPPCLAVSAGRAYFPRPVPFPFLVPPCRELGKRRACGHRRACSASRQGQDEAGAFPKLALFRNLHELELVDRIGVVPCSERPLPSPLSIPVQEEEAIFNHVRPPARTARRRGYSSPSRANRCDNGYVSVTTNVSRKLQSCRRWVRSTLDRARKG